MLLDKQILTQKAGLSWAQLSKPSGFDSYDALYYACEDSRGRIYAGGQGWVYYTDNDGISWTATNNGRSDGLVCLYNDSIVSLHTGNGGLKISTDRGATWSAISGAGSGNWPLACPLNDDSLIDPGKIDEVCIMLAIKKNGSGSNITYRLYAYKFNQSNTAFTLDTSNEVNIFYIEPLKMVQCKKVPTGDDEYWMPAGNSTIIQFNASLELVYQEYSLYGNTPTFRTLNILNQFTLIDNLTNQYLDMTVHIHDVCVTNTGRIIVLFSRQDTTSAITLERYYIAYNDTLDINNWVVPGNSDTVLGNIIYHESNDIYAKLCAIDNRIMIVCSDSNGWRYSDDDGLTWNTYDPTQDITALGNSKIVGLPSNKIFYAAPWQMYLSTPTYITVKELGKHNKYLDRTGLQEIHTQLMSYIQEVQQS